MENDRELKAIEKIVTLSIIRSDANSVFSLMKSEHDPVFALLIIPYYALFVQSCQEFFNVFLKEEPAAFIIRHIRNHIKKYADGFEKAEKEISQVNKEHDQHFRDQLSFDFLKAGNIHYNIGTYWNDSRQIVGNTQMIAAFLGIKDVFSQESKSILKDVGYQLGAFVNTIRNGIPDAVSAEDTIRVESKISIDWYADYNTDNYKEYAGAINNKHHTILYLNVLCGLNFVRHVLKPMFDDNNNWMLRIEYINTYYCHRALKRFSDYHVSKKLLHKDNEISRILETGSELFNTSFRNCMMHYNLEDRKILKREYIDRPYFGLVESCFSGMDYYTYRNRLTGYQSSLIDFINQKFYFEGMQLKKLTNNDV